MGVGVADGDYDVEARGAGAGFLDFGGVVAVALDEVKLEGDVVVLGGGADVGD